MLSCVSLDVTEVELLPIAISEGVTRAEAPPLHALVEEPQRTAEYLPLSV